MASIDVVVPCYNYQQYLRDGVSSILSQPVSELRVLIIDNASTDGSLEVARALAAEDKRVSVIAHAKNVGPIASYNEGIDWAQADYFLLVDADDVLAPGALKRAVAVLDENPDVSFAYGLEVAKAFGPGEMPAIAATSDSSWQICDGNEFIRRRADLDNHLSVGSSTVVRRTAAQKAVGYYRKELPFTNDVEMWLRLATVGKVAATKAVQAVRRLHGLQQTEAYRKAPLRMFTAELATFESFFDREGARHPDAEELRGQVRRMLAKNALYFGLSLLREGDEANGRELINFSLKAWPSFTVPRLAKNIWTLDRPVQRLAGLLTASLS